MFIRHEPQHKQTLQIQTGLMLFLLRLGPNTVFQKIMKRLFPIILAIIASIISITSSNTMAQTTGTGASGLPVPRFVSLKSQNVNMRIGPGKQYQIDWKFVKKGLPIEIIQEYENWRKVRDPEGSEGWILHSLLSGKRTVIVNPGEIGKSSGIVPMYATASREGQLVGRLEAGVVANILTCTEDWCEVTAGELKGHVEKKKLWGVYPDELIE